MKSLTISQLSYAVILSDNPAANILVRQLGGLQNLNKFIKKLGDNETIIAADEPEVNYTQLEWNSQYAATNDVAIIWSKNQQPIALGILYPNPNDKNAPK